MNTPGETFNKTERLCSRKTISLLFEEGDSFYLPLYKVVWKIVPLNADVPAQVAFSVSKKGFKHAVTRNLIRRRMREAYRKNKQYLYNSLSGTGTQVAFMIIYRKNRVPEYSETETAMKELLEKLVHSVIKGIKKS
jgi:ribonuclease P protein component